jgi:L-ribulose-5-phosphate 3-epimerase
MQGRLSDVINGKVQAFPTHTWESEFQIAGENQFEIIEWTIDYEGFSENPLVTELGQFRIRQLSKEHGIRVASVTADCFMQMPFWNLVADRRNQLEKAFRTLCTSAAAVGSRVIVLPLVDDGRPRNEEAFNYLIDLLWRFDQCFAKLGIAVALELDLSPESVAALLRKLPNRVGINFDIGNSAASGFDPAREIREYGQRILNVHVKDRVLGGATVPLGQGCANFPVVFWELRSAGYSGNLILQTARSRDGDHLKDLVTYRKFIAEML